MWSDGADFPLVRKATVVMGRGLDSVVFAGPCRRVGETFCFPDGFPPRTVEPVATPSFVGEPPTGIFAANGCGLEGGFRCIAGEPCGVLPALLLAATTSELSLAEARFFNSEGSSAFTFSESAPKPRPSPFSPTPAPLAEGLDVSFETRISVRLERADVEW